MYILPSLNMVQTLKLGHLPPLSRRHTPPNTHRDLPQSSSSSFSSPARSNQRPRPTPLISAVAQPQQSRASFPALLSLRRLFRSLSLSLKFSLSLARYRSNRRSPLLPWPLFPSPSQDPPWRTPSPAKYLAGVANQAMTSTPSSLYCLS